MSFIFGRREPAPVQPIDPAEDVRELRKRIAKRGGEQSTILTGGLLGRTATAAGNVFKQNLAGTRR